MRKLTISWAELQAILCREGKLLDYENVKELTLTKPRQLLIRTEQAEQVSK